ncbi:MAG: DoxX family membrane protein [Proteiniphilum sp.]|jgi:thiosulfate dehydrogenase [quinone] large subunit|uniref:DoxX family membrane protein n=1 Tax=Proteiniphilum sp. TaxID=1926877 RepID=UPI0009294DDF|nr:DoxX family membrane protein [Proteiniphilum sp.]MEA5127013.1 DoxX family membrane protein [Proteiniphilum sp.]OJV81879.1 MAG: DoxX subfamily [Bacteroidia bacterium 44-10]
MQSICYSKLQLYALFVLRVLIGWYFLYEGLAKVFTPNWSAYGYLIDSKGIFASLFVRLAENPTLLEATNFINIWGLTIVGLLLILGLFSNIGYIGAMIFLLLYYLSHPPLLFAEYILPTEGSYLWVDKNLILLVTVAVLMLFPASRAISFDNLLFRKSK